MMATPSKPVWLITGCSTGLGSALATHIQHSDHHIVATAREPSSLSYLPDTDDVLKLPLDVTSKPRITAAFSAALSKFGRVDYVVNNAGYGILVEAEATEEVEPRGMFETNFWRSVNVAVEVVKVFRGRNPVGVGGMLIQISSLSGAVGVNLRLNVSWKRLSKEMHPKWNIKVLIAEPGAIKETAFIENIRSARDIHPAYRDPYCPTNRTRAWIESPGLEDDFPTATAMAVTLLDTIMTGDLPLRLPLGRDSWEGIHKESVDLIETLEEWRAVSERPAILN